MPLTIQNIIANNARGLTPSLWSDEMSLLLDGVDESVDFGRISEIEGVTNFSFTTRIKTNRITGGMIFQANNSSSLNFRMEIQPTAKLRFRIGANSVFSTTSLALSTWYDITYVFDGSLTGNTNRAKIYVNGVREIGSTSGTMAAVSSNTTASLTVGSTYSGYIKSFSVFDYSLTASEVTEVVSGGNLLLGSFVPPVHYYVMEDSVIPTIFDSGSVGGNDGTTTNCETSDITLEL
jgi:hypothetical protein